MPDVGRLQADAEEAEIRGEMARAHLEAARRKMHRLGIRWSKAKERKSIALSAATLGRSSPRSMDG